MEHDEANAAARERIRAAVAGRSEDELARQIEGGWTVAGLLGHLAFWDRVHGGRLRRALEAGEPSPPEIPDGLTDLINDAAIPAWTSVSGAAAVRHWEQASQEVNEFVASLSPAQIDAVRAAGAPRLIERFRHRNEHGEAIQRALMSDSPPQP